MQEKQKEKKEIEDLMEEEILKNCKKVKKTKKEIDNFIQRNYNEAEKRKIKNQKKLNKLRNSDELNMEEYMSNYGESHLSPREINSFSPGSRFVNSTNNNNNKSRSRISYDYANSRRKMKYNFQVIIFI